MKHMFLVTALLLSAFRCFPLLAQSDDDRIKVGLALSGGGARGGAHIGVLKALEDLHVPVDYIAGTSMGAIIGGFYAAGYSADEIEELMNGMDWDRALRDTPDRNDRTMRKKEVESEFLIRYRLGYNKGRMQAALGAIEGQHLNQVFQKILQPVLDIREFDELAIPFRAVATDLVTGDEVVLSGGSLADALRASMSVPGVFAPVRIGERLLVDGGMANNLPVSVVRAMGADVVIAVDISTPLLTEEELTSVLSVTEQLTGFLTRRSTERQIESLGPRDVLIVPDLGEFSSADFRDSGRIIPVGLRAALDQRDALLALSVPGREEHRLHAEPEDAPYIVSWVDIRNNSVLNDELIRSRLAVQPGEALDLVALDRSVDRIYSLDVFESVTYDLKKNAQGERGVQINADARSWGPNYLQFGLELSNDFSGNSDFKLGAGYTRNALNPLGGELRVVGSIGREDEARFDFYQPIDLGAHWFVNPKLQWKRRNYNLWVEDSHLAEFEIAGWNTWLGIGRNFGTADQLRLDYEFGRAQVELITGYLPFPYDDKVNIGEVVLAYRHDSLDSIHFPTAGSGHNILYRYANDSLGAVLDYQQVWASGILALSSGKNTAVLNYEAGYSIDDATPLERWYRLGGLSRLSGLAPDQLSGRHIALASLALYRRLNEVSFLPAYAGLTLEAGNVWNTHGDITPRDLRYSTSLFIGAESPLGPLYFALGYSDAGAGAVYFYLGNPFRLNRLD